MRDSPGTDDFFSDNISGSTNLLVKAFSVLRNLCQTNRNPDFRHDLKEFISGIRTVFPTMESLQKLSTELSKTEELPIDDKELADRILKLVDRIQFDHDQLSREILKHLLPFVKKRSRIVTLSKSETVIDILLEMHKLGLVECVFAAESRPAYEGRLTAMQLSSNGVKCVLGVDASIDKFVEKSDLAIIGADTIFSDYSVVNKVGSRFLALSCRDRKKSLFIVSSSDKVSEHAPSTLKQSEKDPYEVLLDSAEHQIEVINEYFELIESDLITHIVTEKGILK